MGLERDGMSRGIGYSAADRDGNLPKVGGGGKRGATTRDPSVVDFGTQTGHTGEKLRKGRPEKERCVCECVPDRTAGLLLERRRYLDAYRSCDCAGAVMSRPVVSGVRANTVLALTNAWGLKAQRRKRKNTRGVRRKDTER